MSSVSNHNKWNNEESVKGRLRKDSKWRRKERHKIV